MERIDENGERREVSPDEVAHLDQVQARFEDLTGQLMMMREMIKRAATRSDGEAMAKLTMELGQLCREEWPEAGSMEISYIMFLLHMIEEARAWTQRTFAATELALKLLGGMSAPSHPLRTLPGFDQDNCDEELQAMGLAVKALSDDSTFTTDTGVTLHNVHAADTCEGPFCVVHNPAPGPWGTWEIHWREDWKLMVRRCPHGNDHVAIEEQLRMPLLGLISHDHPTGCDCVCDLSRVETITDAEGNITGFKANDA